MINIKMKIKQLFYNNWSQNGDAGQVGTFFSVGGHFFFLDVAASHHPCRCTTAFTPPLILFFSDYLLQELMFGITQGFCMFHAATVLESKIVTFLRRFWISAGLYFYFYLPWRVCALLTKQQDRIKMEQIHLQQVVCKGLLSVLCTFISILSVLTMGSLGSGDKSETFRHYNTAFTYFSLQWANELRPSQVAKCCHNTCTTVCSYMGHFLPVQFPVC